MLVNQHLKKASAALIAGGASLWSGLAAAAWTLNMREGVTEFSREAYALHMIVLWVCVVIGIVVFGAMFYSIIKFRKSKGAQAAHFHENTTAEILWTLIPFAILVVLAVPATKALVKMESTGGSDLTIKVTGYQWMWHYDYLDQGIAFYSKLDNASNEARQVRSGVDVSSNENYLLDVDKPLVLPVGKKVRILTTANDVIHAWWVPDLGWKRDAVPGFINESWTKIDVPGTYRGQCTELCGKDHGFMPVVVVAKAQADYDQWVADYKAAQEAATRMSNPDREWAMDELMSTGEAVFNKLCAGNADGGLQKLAARPMASGDVANLIDALMFGNPEFGVEGMGATLTDIEIAALATYQRNALGNAIGDQVQPATIKNEYR